MRLALAGLLLAGTPALALADGPPPADSPVEVSINTDASAPSGAVRTTTEVVVQPRLPPQVDARLALSFGAGEQGEPTPSWAGVSTLAPLAWSRAAVSLQAAWTAPLGAKIKLEASNELRTQSFVGPAALNSRPMSLDQAQAARLDATAPLWKGVSLTLGAGVGADDGAVDLVQDGSLVRRAALADERGDLTSQLAWTISPKLSLELADKLVSRSVSWGQAGLSDDYVALEPRAEAVLKPMPGAEWSLAVEHATSPLQISQFAALAEAAETAQSPAAANRLRPDESWRLKAAVAHKFGGGGALSVAYTQADLESSTELVEIAPGVQAPGSVFGGQRRQWDLSLKLPLELIGLDALSLQSSGVVRQSEIPDPITGEMRAPSGEVPYEARLGLVADLPRRGVRLGLQSQAAGPQTVYSLTRVDEVSVSPSLGAFIEYRPADLAVRLQLDDLAGADRRYTSVLYGDSRDGQPTGEIDRRVPGGPGFSLSLRKAL